MPFAVAVTVAVAFELCGNVVAVNVPVIAPETTVMLPGTVAAALLELLSVTIVPPVGAGPDKVTVPVRFCPPNAVVGDTVNTATVTGAVTVMLTCFVVPPRVALMFAVAFAI